MILKKSTNILWRRVIVSILLFGVAMVQSTAQSNLILNGDFESLNLFNIEGSFSIDGVEIKSPKRKDVFHARWMTGDSINQTYVASAYWNFNDDSTAVGTTYYSNTGKANNGYVFGQIRLFQRGDKDIFRTSHLVGRTCHPLIKGNSYHFSFWIRFAKGNTLVDHVDVFFSEDVHSRTGTQKVRFKKKKIIPLEDESPLYQVEKLPSDCKVLIPENTIDGYQLVTCDYIARGGETYIYFGNLDYELPESIVKVMVAETGKKKFQTPYCYYYIDDVVLVSRDQEEICIEPQEETLITEVDTISELTPNLKPIVKKEIEIGEQYFASGSHILSSPALLRLEEILSTINYANLRSINITGYTDDVGDVEDNQILSLKRAEAIRDIVEQYFSNIQVFGKGENLPKYSNQTEEGRLKNRRVTLELIYK